MGERAGKWQRKRWKLSWNERVWEITRGVQTMCGTWMKPAAFGEVYLIQAWTERDGDVGEENTPNRGIRGPFLLMLQVKRRILLSSENAKPRCFNNLKDIKRPYGCWYNANPKTWMNTEIMKDALARLNEKLKRKSATLCCWWIMLLVTLEALLIPSSCNLEERNFTRSHLIVLAQQLHFQLQDFRQHICRQWVLQRQVHLSHLWFRCTFCSWWIRLSCSIVQAN